MPQTPAAHPGPKVPDTTSRTNRGPAAAAENRAAILAAARRLFATEGLRVPLSAIAREAQVGQGVMYRHFSGRLDLAYAVFEENLVALEDLARREEPGGFELLWRELLGRTVTSAAFVEIVLEARRDTSGYDGATRLGECLRRTLARDAAAGLVPEALTARDVMLAWRMAFGIVTTAESPEQALDDLAGARLLGIDLRR